MNRFCKFAEPDIKRNKRQGFPEAIYSPGKTVEQIIHIAGKLLQSGAPIIVTRAEPYVFKKLKKKFKNCEYNKLGRIIILRPGHKKNARISKPAGSLISIVTAGTSDIPIAEEAAVTCEILGSRVERIYDIGIAGIHRVENNIDRLKKSSCIIVCAGMEGALPGIIGGLVSVPVIGVPTSVGYGSSFNGLTPLLSILSSCVANVCSVNIDDGYGAGVIAHLINKGRS